MYVHVCVHVYVYAHARALKKKEAILPLNIHKGFLVALSLQSKSHFHPQKSDFQ